MGIVFTGSHEKCYVILASGTSTRVTFTLDDVIPSDDEVQYLSASIRQLPSKFSFKEAFAVSKSNTWPVTILNIFLKILFLPFRYLSWRIGLPSAYKDLSSHSLVARSEEVNSISEWSEVSFLANTLNRAYRISVGSGSGSHTTTRTFHIVRNSERILTLLLWTITVVAVPILIFRKEESSLTLSTIGSISSISLFTTVYSLSHFGDGVIRRILPSVRTLPSFGIKLRFRRASFVITISVVLLYFCQLFVPAKAGVSVKKGDGIQEEITLESKSSEKKLALSSETPETLLFWSIADNLIPYITSNKKEFADPTLWYKARVQSIATSDPNDTSRGVGGLPFSHWAFPFKGITIECEALYKEGFIDYFCPDKPRGKTPSKEAKNPTCPLKKVKPSTSNKESCLLFEQKPFTLHKKESLRYFTSLLELEEEEKQTDQKQLDNAVTKLDLTFSNMNRLVKDSHLNKEFLHSVKKTKTSPIKSRSLSIFLNRGVYLPYTISWLTQSTYTLPLRPNQWKDIPPIRLFSIPYLKLPPPSDDTTSSPKQKGEESKPILDWHEKYLDIKWRPRSFKVYEPIGFTAKHQESDDTPGFTEMSIKFNNTNDNNTLKTFLPFKKKEQYQDIDLSFNIKKGEGSLSCHIAQETQYIIQEAPIFIISDKKKKLECTRLRFKSYDGTVDSQIKLDGNDLPSEAMILCTPTMNTSDKTKSNVQETQKDSATKQKSNGQKCLGPNDNDTKCGVLTCTSLGGKDTVMKNTFLNIEQEKASITVRNICYVTNKSKFNKGKPANLRTSCGIKKQPLVPRGYWGEFQKVVNDGCCDDDDDKTFKCESYRFCD